MFGHKNGARTMLSPDPTSKRSNSKGRKGTRSCQYATKAEIATLKFKRNMIQGRKGKWFDHMDMVYSNRINAQENNLNFAS